MELKRIKQIRDLEAEAISLRNTADLAETESQLTLQERWEALNNRIKPYLIESYNPDNKGSHRNVNQESSTETIEVSPADESVPAAYLQISSHSVGPYLRAFWSFGEFPAGFGHLPGVKLELGPITESYSPNFVHNGLDERLALGLLTAVELSVEEFCNAMQPEEL